MPRNIEIKARVESIEAITPKVAALTADAPTEIVQDDTFFVCDSGRIKLRTFVDGTGELIHYRRDDRRGPKTSFYLRSPTAEPESLRDVLAQSYGKAGRVVKHRIVFMVGRTRVHLDRVEQLGDFLEIEVVLRDDEAPHAARQEALDLMARIGIEASQLVEGAYVDLLPGSASSVVARQPHPIKPLTVSPIEANDPDLPIAASLFDRYRQFYGQPPAPGRALDYLRARLRASESVVLLARVAGIGAGMAQLYPGFSSIGCCPTMVLNDLYVDPRFEGQGVGEALVTAAKAQARQWGATSLLLETAVDNLRAQRLYERLGFMRCSGFLSYACPLPAAAGDVT